MNLIALTLISTQIGGLNEEAQIWFAPELKLYVYPDSLNPNHTIIGYIGLSNITVKEHVTVVVDKLKSCT